MKTTKSDDQYNTQRGSCDSDEANAMVIRISSMKILHCEIESIEWSWIWNVQYISYSVLEVLIAFMNYIVLHLKRIWETVQEVDCKV